MPRSRRRKSVHEKPRFFKGVNIAEVPTFEVFTRIWQYLEQFPEWWLSEPLGYSRTSASRKTIGLITKKPKKMGFLEA